MDEPHRACCAQSEAVEGEGRCLSCGICYGDHREKRIFVTDEHMHRLNIQENRLGHKWEGERWDKLKRVVLHIYTIMSKTERQYGKFLDYT